MPVQAKLYLSPGPERIHRVRKCATMSFFIGRSIVSSWENGVRVEQLERFFYMYEMTKVKEANRKDGRNCLFLSTTFNPKRFGS